MNPSIELTRCRLTAVCAAVLAVLAWAAPAGAMEIDTANPDLGIRWDSNWTIAS